VTSEQDTELDLRHLVGVLWRRAWVVVLLVALGAAVGYVWTARQPDLYAATAQVQVRDPNAALLGLGAAQGNTATGDREINTQLEFIKSTEVRQAAEALLGTTSAPVRGVSASNVSGTDLINIRVVSRSPEVAQRAANAYAEAYVASRKDQLTQVLEDQAADRRTRADELTQRIAAIDAEVAAAGPTISQAEEDSLDAERQSALAQRADLQQAASDFEITASTKSAGVLVVEPASLPSRPFEPTPVRSAALGGVLGLLLGVGLVFLLERLDDRVTSPEQVEQLTGGVPVVGTIPVHGAQRRWGRRKLPHGTRALVALDSPIAEAYRTLQTSIRFSSLGKSKQTLLVTSSVSGEGKSTCTANLAAMLADSGLRVVVISADLRKPMVASIFGVPETVKGLTSVLLGDATLAESLVPVPLANGKQVYVLPAGPLPHNPAELLGSKAFGAMLREIEDAGADFVLIDCAPVLPVSDPLTAAQHVDGVLVLTVAGESKRHNLVEAVSRLRQVEADVVGVVLNGVPTRGSGYSYYYRSGYGGYGTNPKAPAPPSTNGSGEPPSNGSAPGPMGVPGQVRLPGT
jgi:capsular exopolysaccharide synthesis family protein